MQKDPVRERELGSARAIYSSLCSNWITQIGCSGSGVMLLKPPHLVKVTPRCPLILTRKLRVMKDEGFEASQVNIRGAGGVSKKLVRRRPDSASE